MRYILLLLLAVELLALSSVDVDVDAIVHSEEEFMLGKSSDENLSFDSNGFSSLYGSLLLNYNINEDIFVSFGAKGNIVLGENRYETPAYLRTKITADEINQAIISEASINYESEYISLNLGRQYVEYDWLMGSIDGALAMIGNDEDISLRLFWFENYRHLQYNYYVEVEDINAQKGMYGAIAKTNVLNFDVELFDYFVEDLRNILGVNVSYYFDKVALNASYTSAKALPLALYSYDEEFFNSSLELLLGNNFIEIGYSKTGKNGLLAMIQMGNFMFGQFYLSNQVDRENAQNVFGKYIVASEKWRFELIGGATEYDNSFVEIQNTMHSYEIDSYLTYEYSKYLSFDSGVMYMDVDERDPLQVDQALVMLNMVINYENY